MAEFREEPPPMNDHDENDADKSDKDDDNLFSSAIDVSVDMFQWVYGCLLYTSPSPRD